MEEAGDSRLSCGVAWLAVAVSTAIASFWAFWGVNENFHEGWYYRSLWRNVLLLLAQYLSPALIVMAIGAVVLRWPRVAPALLIGLAAACAWFFHFEAAGLILIAAPLAAMGGLYYYGRPKPRRWAWRALIGLPTITALLCGIGPWWTAFRRLDDENYGSR